MAKLVLGSGVSRCLANGAGAGGDVAMDVQGNTLRAALEQAFTRHPELRGYVLDERGVVRHHVAIFVDAESIRDKAALDLPVASASEIHVMQALSGG